MANWQDFLYVADIDELIVIDSKNSKVAKRFPAPDVNPGLNDVTVRADGELFVSGSFSQSI
jgi:hypothetical protein